MDYTIFSLILLFVVDVLLMLAAGIMPILIIVRVKNKELRLLAAMLSGFAISHSIYHLAGSAGQQILAFGVLQPLSVLFLLALGFLLLRRG